MRNALLEACPAMVRALDHGVWDDTTPLVSAWLLFVSHGIGFGGVSDMRLTECSARPGVGFPDVKMLLA